MNLAIESAPMSAISSGQQGHGLDSPIARSNWTAHLDKLICLTDQEPNTAAIKDLAKNSWKIKSNYRTAWVNRIRTGVTFAVHHTPRFDDQVYHSKFECNPSRLGSHAEVLALINAVYPNCDLTEPKIVALHAAVDLSGSEYSWRELRRRTFLPGMQKIQIYNGGFAIGKDADKRLSVYWKWLRNENGLDHEDVSVTSQVEDEGLPRIDETRVELQLRSKNCSQYKLSNLEQIQTLNPFQTHGVEFWEPVPIESRELGEMDMLKVAGLLPFIDYCGSFFHFRKVMNQNGNFSRISNCLQPCSRISASALDAAFTNRMKTFFKDRM